MFKNDQIKLTDFGSYYSKPSSNDKTVSLPSGLTIQYIPPEYKVMGYSLKQLPL
jgi:hypothetical protein